MDWIQVLYALAALGGLGAVFGLVLAVASRVFHTEQDGRLAEIESALPGANCGGCGYPGCSNLALAILEGRAAPNACPVGGADCAKRIAAIMGVPESEERTRMTALVRCSGGVRAKKKYEYAGLRDCAAALGIAGGATECQYGCIGLGTCLSACAFGAISIVDGVAVIDRERCTACMKCVSACPRKIIVPTPYDTDVNVLCSSKDKGGVLRNICEIGCIGCRICVKVCKHEAISVEDNLARIDYEKCTGCGDCAEKCPRKLIVDVNLDKGPRLLKNEDD